jgi:predicted dehydrogenase
LADTLTGAARLIERAKQLKVPLLTGHHRRHNPMVRRAKAIIESGQLGRLVTAHGFFLVKKPDEYFDAAWRREAGAGPVLLNLIHDIDLMRHLCGEVETVQAFQSNMVRNYPVDETTVVCLKFANGALGTMNISDTVVAPWSWEHTTGENPAYPHTDQSCYFIAGTDASLSLPRLEIWSNVEQKSWLEPFKMERSIASAENPLRLQIEQFCRVIRGEEAPLVSGEEGLKTLGVVDAIRRAAASGQSAMVNAA